MSLLRIFFLDFWFHYEIIDKEFAPLLFFLSCLWELYLFFVMENQNFGFQFFLWNEESKKLVFLFCLFLTEINEFHSIIELFLP